MEAQELYVSLGQLIASAPAFADGEQSVEDRMWLARAIALVEEGTDVVDYGRFKTLCGWISQACDQNTLHEAFDILYRSLARAEIRAPVAARGAFINAGAELDAMAAVGRVLSEAKRSIMIVDPYLDEKALIDFAPLAAENVSIHLLGDVQDSKPTLQPAKTRFSAQYGAARPIEVRLSPHRLLHDRLIIVDDQTVWSLTQSLNAFARRSPASIIKVDPDTTPLKIAAYDGFWQAAQVMA